MWLCSNKLYLQKELEGQIWPVGHKFALEGKLDQI